MDYQQKKVILETIRHMQIPKEQRVQHRKGHPYVQQTRSKAHRQEET